jgi:L-asparaginase II
MTNPVLIEVTRGPLVESVHRGAVVVARPSSIPLLALGNIARPVYPRSAIKLIQALPIIETGAADRFGLTDGDLALACGSHIGSPYHVAVAREMLAKLALDQTCLVCGAAEPQGAKARQTLAASGGVPTPLHHNCSGKHIGMLASALALNEPVAGYADASHPIQQLIHKTLAELAASNLGADVSGLDGCCVPTWAMPLETLARMFAKIATGEQMPAARRAAFDRILTACWREPELVAGLGRADTTIMAALPNRIFLKLGAEGVYCGAIPELGLGFALKIDDGTTRASAAAVMPLIERLLPEARGLIKRSVLRTATGTETGTIRASADYDRALDRLRV